MTEFNLTVITYHYVRDVAGTEFPNLKAMAVADFERQLDFLQKRYSIVAWPQVADFLNGGTTLPVKPCLLTFDDGTKDHYTNVFPRLKERGISGLFFAIVPTDSNALRPVHMTQLLLAKFGYQTFRRMFEEHLSSDAKEEFIRQQAAYIAAHPEGKFGEVESRAFRKVLQSTFLASAMPVLIALTSRYMSEISGESFYITHDEIAEMVHGGMLFGGHGKRHEYLTLMTPEEIKDELTASKEFLTSIHQGPYAFNYPYGPYDQRTVKLVKDTGFIAAFATDNKGPRQDNQFELHRFDATLFFH